MSKVRKTGWAFAFVALALAAEWLRVAHRAAIAGDSRNGPGPAADHQWSAEGSIPATDASGQGVTSGSGQNVLVALLCLIVGGVLALALRSSPLGAEPNCLPNGGSTSTSVGPRVRAVGHVSPPVPVCPTASIDDVSVTEADSGTTPATFTVSLSGPTSLPVSVQLFTFDDTAISPGDYQGINDSVTIAPGQPISTVSIDVRGDTLPENNEEFLVFVCGGDQCVSGFDQGTGTILDDDAAGTTVSGRRDVRRPNGQGGAGRSVRTTPSQQPIRPAPNLAEPPAVVPSSALEVPSPTGELALDRPSVVPGGALTATGRGCSAGDEVLLSTAEMVVGTTTAAADGTFRANLGLPPLSLGRHTLLAQCGSARSQAVIDVVLSTSTPAPTSTLGVVLCFFVLVIILLIRNPMAEAGRRLASSPR